MDTQKKLALLEEMMDLEEGTLTPETLLNSLDEWDSLAKLSLIVLMEDECGKKITGNDVRSFTMVKEILECMG